MKDSLSDISYSVDDAWHCFTTTNRFTSIMYLENETRQGFIWSFSTFQGFWWVNKIWWFDKGGMFQSNKKKTNLFVYSLIIFITYYWEFIIRLNKDIIIQICSSYTRCLYVSNKMLKRWVCLSLSLILLSTSTREGNILCLSC
jgi:hypothetical protein